MIRRYRVLLIAVVVVLAALVVSALYRRVPEVEVARAEYGRLTLPVAAAGLVEARASDVGFKEAGRVVEVYVEEGARVRRDQLLARVFPASGLSLGPSAPDMGDVITAPFDGSVVVVYRRAGAVVQPGEPVLRLVEAGSAWVTAFIEPEDAAYLQRGHVLQCRVGGYLSPPQRVIVEEIGQEAVPRPDLPASSRQVRVRCRPADASFALPPGTEVDIDGEVPLLGRGLLIPAGAVIHRGGTDLVWLVIGGGTVRRREVKIGANNFERIAITEGLQAGETVVVSGKDELREGQRVRPVEMAEAQP